MLDGRSAGDIARSTYGIGTTRAWSSEHPIPRSAARMRHRRRPDREIAAPHRCIRATYASPAATVVGGGTMPSSDMRARVHASASASSRHRGPRRRDVCPSTTCATSCRPRYNVDRVATDAARCTVPAVANPRRWLLRDPHPPVHHVRPWRATSSSKIPRSVTRTSSLPGRRCHASASQLPPRRLPVPWESCASRSRHARRRLATSASAPPDVRRIRRSSPRSANHSARKRGSDVDVHALHDPVGRIRAEDGPAYDAPVERRG